MSLMLLLSLSVVTVIHLTSSQSTYDVNQQENDVISCGRSENFERTVLTALSQLQKEVAELKDAIGDKTTKECPANFTHIPSVNGCYRVVNRNLNWNAAGLECRSLHKDAHLLVINDAQEQSEIAGMLNSTSETTLSGCTQYAIHGVYFATAGQRIDPSRESPFVWRVTSTDTMSLMSYTNWYPGEPDYIYGGRVEACVDLWPAQSYTWNSYPCSTAICSVCELDL